tara:strand:+ start:1314 stop:1994 length:681 start_codon:yes stop_codon:yes gene_type:complete
MVQISRKDLERLAIGFGVADFLSGGKLTAPIGNATRRALVKAGPAIARGIVRYGPAAVGTAARVTPTGAVVSTAALLAIQNREKVAELAAQGYDIVAPAAQQYGAGVLERAMDPETYQRPEPRDLYPISAVPRFSTKRKKSKFNQAVKRGMSIVKASTSYGKKGTINNAKKAFSAVTKAASAVNKGRKAPARGIGRKLHMAMSKILPKKKKTTKKKSKINITVYKK